MAHLTMDVPTAFVIHCKDLVVGWFAGEQDYMKWLPGTAEDQARCRKDAPVLQPVLHVTSGPSKHSVPDQH